jgi:hypothetical protein
MDGGAFAFVVCIQSLRPGCSTYSVIFEATIEFPAINAVDVVPYRYSLRMVATYRSQLTASA